jgi:hypothetical protein
MPILASVHLADNKVPFVQFSPFLLVWSVAGLHFVVQKLSVSTAVLLFGDRCGAVAVHNGVLGKGSSYTCTSVSQ